MMVMIDFLVNKEKRESSAISTSSSSSEVDLECFNLPVSTLDELLELESSLLDETRKKQLVKVFESFKVAQSLIINFYKFS